MATSSSSFEANLNTAKTVLSTAASLAATLMLARSVARDLLPHDLQDNFFWGVRSFFSRFSSQLTMVIDEFNGLENNQIYEAAQIYLASKVSPSTQRIKVSKPGNEKGFIVSLEGNEEVADVFNGVKFKWALICTQIEPQHFHNPHHFNSTVRSMSRSFELSFHKKHREMALESYLPYIVKEAKSMKQEIKTLKIFTVDYQNIYNLSNLWISTNLDHPATFNKLAMDSEIKDFILKDLELFVRRKEFYRQVGKAWKRGYLLYGPPGTGKSSLIAAMANYLKFDIYDLELTELHQNSDLRKLLITIANRSILVVEDIDCTIDFHHRDAQLTPPDQEHHVRRRKEVTLSGLLNFIDGLWSSCGDERIIVFTTNRKEKLDPALLRPGRMDVHVHMSYCTPCGFRLLANNYLGLNNHPLFSQIEDALLDAQVTPAEVAEQLLKGEDGDAVLCDLTHFLSGKKKEKEEAMAEKVRQELEEKNSLQVGKAEEKKKDDDGENIN